MQAEKGDCCPEAMLAKGADQAWLTRSCVEPQLAAAVTAAWSAPSSKR